MNDRTSQGWPRFSDAMAAGMAPGKIGKTLDPRTDWEKMTVWEAQDRLRPIYGDAVEDWTKDECARVGMGNPSHALHVTRSMKNAGKAFEIEELPRTSIIAALKARGIVPENLAEISDHELRLFYEQQVTPADGELKKVHVPTGEEVPLEKRHRSTLLAQAKKLGIVTEGHWTKDRVIAAIRQKQLAA